MTTTTTTTTTTTANATDFDRQRSMTEYLIDFADDAYTCETCEGAENWYYRKSAAIHAAARAKGIDSTRAVAAYAVLSANASVLENDRNYVRILHGLKSVGFGSRQARVDLALSGDVAAAIDYVNGEKIPSFFDNLLDPTTSTAVTIDRHAADIVTDGRAESKRILARANREGYRYLAAVYTAAAEALEVRPHELQARAWVHWTTCLSATSTTTISANARKG